MPETLPDEEVDAIRFERVDEPGRFCRATPQPQPELQWFLSIQDWERLRFWLTCLQRGAGGDFDGTGFLFDDDEDAFDYGEFSGVLVLAPPDDAVAVSRGAFERLLGRFYAAVAAEAERRGDPATSREWWPDFRRAGENLGR